MIRNNVEGIKAGLPDQSLVVSDLDGHINTTIPNIGGSDEIWYNPGDHHDFEADGARPGGGVLGTIDARTNMFLLACPTATASKSVAADVPERNGDLERPGPSSILGGSPSTPLGPGIRT